MSLDSNQNNNQINPFKTEYYTDNELGAFGFKAMGKNIRIAKNCTITGLSNISIGDNVIIDAFCTIIASENGHLKIGSHVHIGGSCHLLAAGGGIELKDFSGLSQNVNVYSKTDDYSGRSLTNPTIPDSYKAIKRGKVVFEEHVIIGAGSVILPNVNIGTGTSVGALSLVSTNLDSWTIYIGNPLKRLTNRSQDLLKVKEQFVKDTNQNLE